MIEIFCPDCGSFVEEVYDDELPMEFECPSCSAQFIEKPQEEEDDSY